MRILITGGAGFIGSHLTGLLSSETVTILDDLSAGRLENIPDDANFVCCDVKSPLARDVVKMDTSMPLSTWRRRPWYLPLWRIRRKIWKII